MRLLLELKMGLLIEIKMPLAFLMLMAFYIQLKSLF